MTSTLLALLPSYLPFPSRCMTFVFSGDLFLLHFHRCSPINVHSTCIHSTVHQHFKCNTYSHIFMIFSLFIVVRLSSLRILFFFILIETFLPFLFFFLCLAFFFPVIFLIFLFSQLLRFLFSSPWCFYLLGIHHIFFTMFQLIFLWTTSVKCYAFLDCAETKCHGIVWALFLVKKQLLLLLCCFALQ